MFNQGKWFCSEACGDRDEDLLNLERMAAEAENMKKEHEDMLKGEPEEDVEIDL